MRKILLMRLFYLKKHNEKVYIIIIDFNRYIRLDRM